MDSKASVAIIRCVVSFFRNIKVSAITKINVANGAKNDFRLHKKGAKCAFFVIFYSNNLHITQKSCYFAAFFKGKELIINI